MVTVYHSLSHFPPQESAASIAHVPAGSTVPLPLDATSLGYLYFKLPQTGYVGYTVCRLYCMQYVYYSLPSVIQLQLIHRHTHLGVEHCIFISSQSEPTSRVLGGQGQSGHCLCPHTLFERIRKPTQAELLFHSCKNIHIHNDKSI